MPLYEYQCDCCARHFERIEKVSSPTAGVCPDCGGPARRLLGAPAFKFKGSGWYVTDYGKGNGNRSTALAKTEDGPAPPPKADAKSEKKGPAKKSRDTS